MLRLRAFEERVSALEEVSYADEGTGNCCEGEGLRALRLALAQMLNKENIATAVSELVVTLGHAIKDCSSLKTREFRNQRAIALGTYFGGLAFSAFVLIMLSALLWHDKITRELAAGLLGSLIGYWYGRDKRQN
jgi:hypothetical protein